MCVRFVSHAKRQHRGDLPVSSRFLDDPEEHCPDDMELLSSLMEEMCLNFVFGRGHLLGTSMQKALMRSSPFSYRPGSRPSAGNEPGAIPDCQRFRH